LNADDAPLHSLKKNVDALAAKNHLNVIWFSSRAMAAEAKKIRRVITIPGAHNISNALAVVSLGKILRIPEKNILSALSSYKGAWRRMEYKGTITIKKDRGAKIEKVLVYDDYAHHPTEIKATLAAFKEKFPHSALVCVFQPHQAKRLELLFSEFMAAFDAADVVIILPLYKVLGRDEKLPRDSEALVRAIEKRSAQKHIFYVRDAKKIRSVVVVALNDLAAARPAPALAKKSSRTADHSPVLIMMGAGDIADLTEKIVK
jgi:UDP-N-acetylmuramate-alanine ligase